MIRTSDTVEAISAAWVAAAADMPNVPKETRGQVGNAVRNYADLATVTETVRPILAAHGLAYVQGCSDGDKVVTITTRLVHKSGQWIEDSLTMPTGQNTAQAVGSAITYGRRYSLMAVLGLAPDDDDGAAASHAPKPATRRAAPPAPVVAGDGEAATDKQIQRIQIMMNGRGDRDAKLAFLSEMVGRQLVSSKELTKAEAGLVLDHLDAS